MNPDCALRAYLDHLIAGGAPASTLRLRRQHLRMLAADTGDLLGLTAEHLVRWGAAHPAWAANTRKSIATTLRSFYRWATSTGLVTADPSGDLPRVRAPRGHPRPTPEAVIDQAVSRAKSRERTMLYLALLAGLRRSEVACLHSHDVGADALTITGKGARTRTVPLHPLLSEALAPRLLLAGWVFPGQIDGHLSPGAVGKLCRKLLGTTWSMHTLRHAAASRWYVASGGDLLAVRDLLGHESVATTQVYTATPMDAARAAVLGVRHPLA